MANFISERFANRLNLKRQRIASSIEGVNGQVSHSNNGITLCYIKPILQTKPTFTVQAIILPKVCSNQPNVVVDSQGWTHIKDLPLADPHFDIPSPVDMLLGAEVFPYILGSGRIFGNPGQPVALETVFGWVLQGGSGLPLEYTSLCASVPRSHFASDLCLDSTLSKFWEIENLPSCNIIFSPDETKCEDNYNQLVHREPSGRSVVPLPFKHVLPTLGDSYTQALRRFIHLENRLYKNPEIRSVYSNSITEYIENKIISCVDFADYQSASAFYLPHHCVIKPDSVSTKLRIVFDASAKSSNGFSLNDVLFPGPKLHQDLPELLLRFRTYPLAFICDIKQMYSQIFIRPEHRKYQRFLWRFSKTENIKEYVLNRVTFGAEHILGSLLSSKNSGEISYFGRSQPSSGLSSSSEFSIH